LKCDGYLEKLINSKLNLKLLSRKNKALLTSVYVKEQTLNCEREPLLPPALIVFFS